MNMIHVYTASMEACIDIWKDYSEDEVSRMTGSIRRAWRAGFELYELAGREASDLSGTREVVAGLNLLAGEPRCQHESTRPVWEHTGVPAAFRHHPDHPDYGQSVM